mmetsp:Transcript_46774/g.117872  ORF Transcript_46774/g.117872 Transcript_46774/m.117872 type:complete len:280 (-) Transcript_46774:1219-2058(-)
MDEDGFQRVGGVRGRHKKQNAAPRDPCQTEFNYNNVKPKQKRKKKKGGSTLEEKFSLACASLSGTEFSSRVLSVVNTSFENIGFDENSRLSSIVCYGIGQYGSCQKARLQLALLKETCKLLSVPPKSVYFFDPALSAEEKVFMTNTLGFSAIERNEVGSRLASEPTLFFMVHCGKLLYNNLLRTNWAQLENVVILGNSFSSMLLSKEEKMILWCLDKCQPCSTELVLPSYPAQNDVFNDTSVHVFPLKLRASLPPLVDMPPPPNSSVQNTDVDVDVDVS